MPKFRKKPVVIEAFQFNWEPWPDWFRSKVNDISIRVLPEIVPGVGFDPTDTYCEILTLKGTMRGDCGDYIIKGVNGELYPCKPGIFEKTYERVEE